MLLPVDLRENVLPPRVPVQRLHGNLQVEGAGHAFTGLGVLRGCMCVDGWVGGFVGGVRPVFSHENRLQTTHNARAIRRHAPTAPPTRSKATVSMSLKGMYSVGL